MNKTCANCGGFIGNFTWSGSGAKICNCKSQDVEGKLYEITKPKQYDPKDVERKCEIHNMVGYKCVNCGIRKTWEGWEESECHGQKKWNGAINDNHGGVLPNAEPKQWEEEFDKKFWFLTNLKVTPNWKEDIEKAKLLQALCDKTEKDLKQFISNLLISQRTDLIKEIEGLDIKHTMFCEKTSKDYKKCCACILENLLKKLSK